MIVAPLLFCTSRAPAGLPGSREILQHSGGRRGPSGSDGVSHFEGALSAGLQSAGCLGRRLGRHRGPSGVWLRALCGGMAPTRSAQCICKGRLAPGRREEESGRQAALSVDHSTETRKSHRPAAPGGRRPRVAATNRRLVRRTARPVVEAPFRVRRRGGLVVITEAPASRGVHPTQSVNAQAPVHWLTPAARQPGRFRPLPSFEGPAMRRPGGNDGLLAAPISLVQPRNFCRAACPLSGTHPPRDRQPHFLRQAAAPANPSKSLGL